MELLSEGLTTVNSSVSEHARTVFLEQLLDPTDGSNHRTMEANSKSKTFRMQGMESDAGSANHTQKNTTEQSGTSIHQLSHLPRNLGTTPDTYEPLSGIFGKNWIHINQSFYTTGFLNFIPHYI